VGDRIASRRVARHLGSKASTVAPGCPVHSEFDPLSPRYLEDPFAVMAELPAREEPVFYAPAIDYYVVTRHAPRGHRGHLPRP
jgi:hypothetical protein